MPVSFVHLRIHSEYSLVDGLVRIKPLVKSAASKLMPAVALTDQANLFAAVKFYKAAIAAGIKPLVGADLLLASSETNKAAARLTLLCQNQQGYRHLTRIISRAYLEGQQLGIPLIDKTWLMDNCQGLIALSGGMEGDIGQALLAAKPQEAEGALQFWQQLFPQRFYLEVQRLGKPQEDSYNQAVIDLAERYQVPVVATNDVRFLAAEDFEAHEARVCIHGGYVLNDQRRPQLYTPQQYLRSPAEMAELFADMPEALSNTVEIAKRCNVVLELGKSYLPAFEVPPGLSPEAYLSSQAEAGLAERFALLMAHNSSLAAQQGRYQERLQIELEVINTMGFAGYFLIVADFIQWAKSQGIPVGPGRGSGAGSLVAYALKITDLDPLQYDLLFERFLNPERVSMPDFDIDFCMEGRDRVIDYVASKYGRHSVSQIITYGSMAAKAVIRDVGRVLGHPYGFVDKIAKLIPFELGITLAKALEQEAELKARYEQEEEVKTLVDLGRKLEGITRNVGKHAGGVVIAPSVLTDFSPLYCEEGGDNLVTQFDKDDVEAVGLVKFDFLGLRTLTIIDWAVQNINRQRQRQGEPLLDISLLPMNDAKSFELLKACATTAVFQLESRGMKDLIKRLQPDCFEEIIALVALFRPGPLQSGMVDDFINRKHGRAKVDYPHPDLAPILKPTYGIILYQEQVMQIAQVLANYTLGGADLLRRAMGKKKPEEMAQQREIFLTGATARGVATDLANAIFDLMEKFAGYGFNKSHSAAYALVSYQTAWLKAHYPAEFMAAVLSADMDNTDKVVFLLNECRSMNLAILPPHVNDSQYPFTVTSQGEIRYGLGAIKGAGENALTGIIECREAEGPYKDLFDFCQRIDLRKVNRRVLESLIKAGALDGLGPDRGVMLLSLDRALQAAEQHAENAACGQRDLFGEISSPSYRPSFVDAPAWQLEAILAGEKETLGQYFSGHPLQAYEKELKQLVTAKVAQLKPSEQMVILAGMVMSVRTMLTKRGDKMAFVGLDDRSGVIEFAVFAEQYDEYKAYLQKDQILIVEGTVALDDYSGHLKLNAKRLLPIAQAREIFAKCLRLKWESPYCDTISLEHFESILLPFAGGSCPIVMDYKGSQATASLLLGSKWRVRPEDSLLAHLKALLGDDKVYLDYMVAK